MHTNRHNEGKSGGMWVVQYVGNQSLEFFIGNKSYTMHASLVATNCSFSLIYLL